MSSEDARYSTRGAASAVNVDAGAITPLSDSAALNLIAEILRGHWSGETVPAIAELVGMTGRLISRPR